MNYNELKQIILDQNIINLPENIVTRTIFPDALKLADNRQIIVISGMRRCGKSTLMQAIRNALPENDYYCNFDDERLVRFSLVDCEKLVDVFIELYGVQKTFYFDEIQNIAGWERFIRRLHDAGNKIFITGSNATMFSRELGTRLTGRYIQIELYPFSFREYVSWKKPALLTTTNLTSTQRAELKNLFATYITVGGIPEYIINNNRLYLESLYESIIYRDIIVRYKINDRAIKELVYFLASNCSKEVSYNSLRKLLGLASASTVSDYCRYLEDSFLCFFVNRFAFSLKQQIHSSKKSYFIDQALAKVLGFYSSEDYGRTLENIVFLELKRRGHDIYFHKAKNECDFLVKTGTKISTAIQVCANLELETTRLREETGLITAMQEYNLGTGLLLADYTSGSEIITLKHSKQKIKIMQIWEWLLGNCS